MKEKNKVLVPEHLFLKRAEKEKLLGQKALALWLTGLPASGKTTTALHLENKLHNEGFITKIFDGDIVRAELNKDLGFSQKDRLLNIERIALLNTQFLSCGIIVINCFVSPTKKIRNKARSIIGKKDFIEIYIHCPINICEKRDKKGLYKKAKKGELKDFTGVNSPYEAPNKPHLTIDTSINTVDDVVNMIYEYIIKIIKK